jgi:hypothetical protein
MAKTVMGTDGSRHSPPILIHNLRTSQRPALASEKCGKEEVRSAKHTSNLTRVIAAVATKTRRYNRLRKGEA